MWCTKCSSARTALYIHTMIYVYPYPRPYRRISDHISSNALPTLWSYSFFFNFTLYPSCSRAWGSLVLRHFFPHFPPNYRDIAYRVTKLKVALGEIKILNILLPLEGIEPTTCSVYRHKPVPLCQDWPPSQNYSYKLVHTLWLSLP